MKNTRKIIVAFAMVITILLGVVAPTFVPGGYSHITCAAADETQPETATDGSAPALPFTLDENTLTYIILAAVAVVVLFVVVYCFCFTPKRKPWWMV